MKRSPIFIAPLTAIFFTAFAIAQGQKAEDTPPADPMPPSQAAPEDIAPPDAIEIPEPSHQPKEPGQKEPRRAGPGERLRIRAPFTDIELDGGERPRINVWTPWADVRIDGGSGIRVRTPVGPIHISPDELERLEGEFGEGRLIAPRRAQADGSLRPVLGIEVRDDEGIRVTAVRAGGPADAANLAVGDRIVSLNGVRYANADSLTAAIGRMRAGDAVKIRIERDGKHYQATATLATQQEVLKAPAPAEPQPAQPPPLPRPQP